MWSIENQRAHLDALPRWRVGRAGRVVEGAMRGETRRTMLPRIEAFDQQHLGRLHGRSVVPAMLRAEGHRVGFTDAVAIDEIAGDEILRRDGPRIAYGHRRSARLGRGASARAR